MSNLPEKLQTLHRLAESLLLAAATKAAGPALMNWSSEGEDGETTTTNTPSRTEQFTEQFRTQFLRSFAALLEARAPARTASQPSKTGKAALEERIKKYSLLSKEELEMQLAAERQGRNLFNDNLFAISCLSMRMEKIISRPFLLANNPLHPQNLSLVFRECVDACGNNKNSINAAINSWGKSTEKNYADWLEELNRSLIRQYILPDLDADDVSNRYKHSHEAERNRAQAMRQNLITEVTGKPAEGTGAAEPQELVQGLNQLVKQAAEQTPEIRAHMVGNQTGPAVEISDVLSALRDLKPAAHTNENTGYREISAEDQLSLAELIKTNTNLSSFALNDQAQSAISLLSMMFNKIRQEDDIAAPFKPLINDLQLPVLKKALRDDSFFADADNSAQQLVNEIAKAGSHWTPKAHASRDNFYKKIASIVDDIKEKHETDDNVFEENLNELAELVEKEERRSRVLEERIIEAETAAARQEAARERAMATIAIRFHNKAIPPKTRQFAEQHWSAVLFFHINRHFHEESPELKKALATLDELTDAARGREVDLKQLFATMNQQMVELGMERADREQLFKDLLQELKTARMQAMQAANNDASTQTTTAPAANATTEEVRTETVAANDTTTAETRATEFHATTDNAPIAQGDPSIAAQPATAVTVATVITPHDISQPAPAEEVLDDYHHAASAIRVNSWFHLQTDAQAERQKVKLAAIIKHKGSYIFVNREGIKVLVTDRTGVAQHLRSGLMTMIEDAVFFDRALESVINNLRGQQTATG